MEHFGSSGDLPCLRKRVRLAAHGSEKSAVSRALDALDLSSDRRRRIQDHAVALIESCRNRRDEQSLLDAFLREFGLSNTEGVALMCLAEAALRIPDSKTLDTFISDILSRGDWAKHIGQSDSLFVNASAWGLLLTGNLVDQTDGISTSWLSDLKHRVSEPVLRKAFKAAIRLMSSEFVLGASIEEGLARAHDSFGPDIPCSFDMLGEAARTKTAAVTYFQSYMHAIRAVGASKRANAVPHSISVKLSALHPRYEFAQMERVHQELVPRLVELAVLARSLEVDLTIDAEEAARLDMSLGIFEHLCSVEELKGWSGLGLALQCYGKRAIPVLDWLIQLGETKKRRIPVRLVKGAYWDMEIKYAQEHGHATYPVFTRKSHTDVSYLACAQKALRSLDTIYPQFATHNANTIAAVLDLAGTKRDFEFQRLHGMGELLYNAAELDRPDFPPVRVYAPIGPQKDLLAYLVRRLLENGANTSFVQKFLDPHVAIEDVVTDVIATSVESAGALNPGIPLPPDLFGPERYNSAGLDLDDPIVVKNVQESLREERAALENTFEPFDETTPADLARCLVQASGSFPTWTRRSAYERANVLDRAGALIGKNRNRLMALLVCEARKTIPDALAEVREAEDFCRYYAAQVRTETGRSRRLAGPTGESNELSAQGRGVFACISPWNFPLAIFVGQVVAALAVGNTVIAKPAEQTPRIAVEAAKLLHEAGVPSDVLHVVIGRGETTGAALVEDPRVSGVAFTGSFEAAQRINRTLAARQGPIVPLIAETGGQNAMVVDSSALLEQVTDDIIRSAFGSAGQRCSALRILLVQDEIADELVAMLIEAMNELKLGDPGDLSTDVGPVIDAQARDNLMRHCELMIKRGACRHRLPEPSPMSGMHFVGPHLFELSQLSELADEQFGPLLHFIRFRSDQLSDLMDQLAQTGFGLTMGIHTRIARRGQDLFSRSIAGNVYVNRDMVGAVVGVQPFGGQGLSGTGPKAGGPNYLMRFAVERVFTVNTSATGGNSELLSLPSL